MDDLISRQAAIEAIFSEPLYESGMKKRDADTVVPAIYEKIKSLPSVQPEQKKGRWILSDEQRQEDVDNDNYRFICSECGKSDIHSKAVIVSFCWNCGAEMEGEENDSL